MTSIICLLLLSLQTAGAAPVTGLVRDGSGDVVPGATIVVRAPSGTEEQTTTGPDGRFTVPQPPDGEFVLLVRAPGFAEHRQTVLPADGARSFDVVLAPAALTETVTVTAARTEQLTRNVAASVNLLEREEIARSPAVVADDVLRQIPTFSLFRRTSSLAAHPTAQGVSLRGVGPSGVSRTLVLLDGIPFNDPFGGWVYWTRVPLESVERIEVVDGATSSVYGNYAMGGVINVVSAAAGRRQLDIRSQYGTRTTPKLDISAAGVFGRVGAAIDASAFSTDGYPIVAPAERGAVDENAAVNFQNVALRVQYDMDGRGHAFARAGHFRERRDNGKVSTIDGTEEANDTRWTTASGGVRLRLPDTSDLQVNVFADFARFRSNFLAVPAATPPRSVGRMTLNQRVPTTGVGGMTQWSRSLGQKHFVSAGLDWRWVDGDSEEDALDAVTGTRVTTSRISGGTQRSLGAFVQDLFSPLPRLTLTLAARLDRWRNSDGHNLEVDAVTGLPTANHRPSLPDRRDTVVSPRIAALYHLTDRVTVWGDLGSGFRAPTLNELYRQFRVGTVLTLANDQLGPERLVGGNVGVRVTPVANLSVRSTWYDNRIEDPVSNVTRTVVGANVTQQRQNLGRTRVSGLQTDADYRLGAYRLSAGYMYGRARVVEFDANPSLVGNYLPQVPSHRGSVQLAWVDPRIAQVAIGLQAVGRQFDDDQNLRVVPGRGEPGLPGVVLVEVSASKRVTRRLQIFAGAQNLLDRVYYVGTLPTTLGTPRLVHGGLRIRL
ncbi:MAG TPA: TonB-dependent receptor, partial [Vicinamibacterales bacterium]|nr:TonB-dependent receptor [Vicinamibacterales bacterium]